MKQRKDRSRLPNELRDPKVPVIHAGTPTNRVEEQRSEGIAPEGFQDGGFVRSTGPIPYPGPWILPPDWPPTEI